MNLPNNDDLPWEEDTSMMRPRGPLDIQIVPSTPSMTYPKPLDGMRGMDGYEPWMVHWIHWDEQDQTYVGTCPDNDEICREKDPTIFLLLFAEASHEWTEQQGPC